MEWVFPSNIYCICCGSMIERDRPYALCDKCMEDIHWIRGRVCEKCGKALPDTFRGRRCYNCMMREHSFRRGISCMTYGLKERQMILDFKYNGKAYMGQKFGDILADRLMADSAGVVEYDLIVPVPIHPTRERKRGYNQAELMARRLGRMTGIPVRPKACRRMKQTTLLRSMDPLEREAEMRDAFRVPEGEQPAVAGMRILIVEMSNRIMIRGVQVANPLISRGFANRRASISESKASKQVQFQKIV